MPWKIIVLAVLCSLTGCTSFRTTIMQRSTDSRLYPNQPCALTKGLPVKLKIPTHVEATITEVFFIESTKDTEDNAALNDAKVLVIELKEDEEKKKAVAAGAMATPAEKRAYAHAAKAREDAENKVKTLVNKARCREIPVVLNGQPIRHLEVETKVIYTDKVFTVDFRRPAGGILNLSSIDMDDEQYFKKIQAEYEEQTMKQIRGAIDSVSRGVTARSASLDGLKSPGLAMETRTVAVGRFDVSEPQWETELDNFVATHVTSCHPLCQQECRPEIFSE